MQRYILFQNLQTNFRKKKCPEKNTYVLTDKHVHVLKKDVRVFLKAYNDRGDSLKQGITHILMKEKDVCNELRSIFATWKIISIEINGSNKRISKNDC